MSLSEYVDAGNTNPLIAVGKIVLWFIQKCIALWSDSAFVQYTGISLLSILLAFFAMWVIVNIFVIRPIGVPIAHTIVESSRRSSARARAKADHNKAIRDGRAHYE